MCELKQLYGASKITIPIHEEEGWTVRSPEGASVSVKARLQEATSPKSPEALKRIEERAAQLHRLYVASTQQRAAKENRRAEEVAAQPRHSPHRLCPRTRPCPRPGYLSRLAVCRLEYTL